MRPYRKLARLVLVGAALAATVLAATVLTAIAETTWT